MRKAEDSKRPTDEPRVYEAESTDRAWAQGNCGTPGNRPSDTSGVPDEAGSCATWAAPEAEAEGAAMSEEAKNQRQTGRKSRAESGTP